MLDKLYITPKQWMRIFRWALYSLLLLCAMLVQTVLLGKVMIFGTKIDPVSLVIFCVCLREGPERGGLFALLGSVFWALSGADQGALLIFLLTVLPILASVLLRKIFVRSFFSDLISCGLLLLLTHTGDFLLRLINGTVAGKLYFTRLLPTVLVTLLFQPLIYWLVKIVEKIGDPYEAT